MAKRPSQLLPTGSLLTHAVEYGRQALGAIDRAHARWAPLPRPGRSSRLRASTALSRQVLFDSFEPRQLLHAEVLPIIGQIRSRGQTDDWGIHKQPSA